MADEPVGHRRVSLLAALVVVELEDAALGIPAASARSSARAPAVFEATAAIGSPSSISACRFVPSPRDEDADHVDAPDHEPGARVRGRNDGAHPDPDVEDAALLLLARRPAR